MITWLKHWWWPLIPFICVVVILITVVIISSDIVEAKYNESTCEQLLESIQDDGIKPNYQYDVREWISKECWK